MKKFFCGILPLALVAAFPFAAAADYNVRMYCTAYGQNFDWWQCLNSKYSDGEFELTKNGQKRIYKMYELLNDYELSDGNFRVPDSFSIRTQNVSDTFILGIEIKNDAGRQVYQNEVGKYRVINVGN